MVTKRSGKSKEHFAAMVRKTMETDAWRALSVKAQALYPWLKLEWHGPKFNNNGEIQLSVGQAAERLGVTDNTAASAFHDVQAKGFIVVRELGHLGCEGAGKSTSYEITELPAKFEVGDSGKKLYLNWQPGADYPVKKAPANNPTGRRKKQNPI